ncbi:MAG: rhodanese-like domain-containing protein [Actinomycetales bacterium]|nr:rhodanese-like domain-containing protein [Actinomycetales bacterium]
MRNRSLALAASALVALSLGLVGCSSSTDTAAPAATSSVQGPAGPVAAPSSPERVDVSTFAGVVTSPGVTVIDVRTPEEFAAGHIAGAVNIDVQGPDFASQIGGLDAAGTYAVYCHSGNRSQAAVAEMANAGINGIYELDGGIAAWEAAGQPVVQ